MSHSTFYAKKGDINVPISTQLLDDDGQAVSLLLASVEFHARKAHSSDVAKISAGICAVTDAANGIVQYVLTQNDLDTTEVYDAEWEVTFQGGEVQTFPNDGHDTLIVTEQLA